MITQIRNYYKFFSEFTFWMASQGFVFQTIQTQQGPKDVFIQYPTSSYRVCSDTEIISLIQKWLRIKNIYLYTAPTWGENDTVEEFCCVLKSHKIGTMIRDKSYETAELQGILYAISALEKEHQP